MKKLTVYQHGILSPAQRTVLYAMAMMDWELRTSPKRCFLISDNKALTQTVARGTWRVLSDRGFIVEDKTKEFVNRVGEYVVQTWVLTAKGRMAV